MQPRDRKDRGAALDGLRVVLRAGALLASVLLVFASVVAPRAGRPAGAAPALRSSPGLAQRWSAGVPAERALVAAERPARGQDVAELAQGGDLDLKPPRRRDVLPGGDPTSCARTAVADTRPVARTRTLAFPIRGPPRA